MRRKSTRTSKLTTDKAPEPSSRKLRRHSKRHKQSSSRSSSEDSSNEDNKVLERNEKQDKVKEANDQGKDESVRTAASSDTPSGKQKSKSNLSKSPHSLGKVEHATRRRRDKSGNQEDQDIATSEEISSRKVRRRGSLEEQEQPEAVEDKKGKGKSKTKHKSKSEKSPKIQDSEEQTQSEFSENAQVTPQSPQAAIDTQADNETPSATDSEIVRNVDESNSVSESINYDNESESVDKENSNTCLEIHDDNVTTVQTKPDIGNSELSNSSDDSNKGFKGYKTNEESVVKEQQQAENVKDSIGEVIIDPEDKCVEQEDNKTKINESQETNENTNAEQETMESTQTIEIESQGDKSEINEEDDIKKDDIAVSKTDESENMEHTHENNESIKPNKIKNTKSQNASIPIDEEHDGETEKMDESQKSDEDSKSADVLDTSCTSIKDTSFKLTSSFSTDVREIVEENKALQCLKDEVSNLFPTPPKRRRKWGNTLVGLDLEESTLNCIDIETLKQFCPDLRFLDESELKMDVVEGRERRVSVYEKDRRTERKVSIDYKNVGEISERHLDTQSSVNSFEMEENTEPEVDNSNIIALNRKISIVDDTASKLKPPPSPAKNPLSEVLYITNLVRPFTLKQLKELLERTGKIRENGFWTDRIKSKCYVYYETSEEAEITRNALHGINWPIGNGKKLIIEYSTPEDLEKARTQVPPVTPAAVVPEKMIPEKENQLPIKRHKPEEVDTRVKEMDRHKGETYTREWDIGKEDLLRVRSRSGDQNDRYNKRRHRRSPSPDFISRKERKREEDIPQKLMDDLFRKTKTSPSIYWLPLTPEEIATKQQQRLLRMAEHKRRMEESSRNRVEYGRGAPYRRRYD